MGSNTTAVAAHATATGTGAVTVGVDTVANEGVAVALGNGSVATRDGNAGVASGFNRRGKTAARVGVTIGR